MYYGPPYEFLGPDDHLETIASIAHLPNPVCQVLVFEHLSNKKLQGPEYGQLGDQKGRLRQKLKPYSYQYPAGKAQDPDSPGHLGPLPTHGWPHLVELSRITNQQAVLPNLDIPPLEKPSAGVCSPGAHLAQHTLERNGLSSRDWRKMGLGEWDGVSPNPRLCTWSVVLPSSPGTRWASGNKRCPQRVS